MIASSSAFEIDRFSSVVNYACLQSLVSPSNITADYTKII